MTPEPTNRHETIAVRLARILDPYVGANDLGFVYRPRAVFRIGKDVEVGPDLMVRQPHADPDGSWESAPLPLLVVEILSDSTRRQDEVTKRSVSMDAGIPEYWIPDGETRTVCMVRRGSPEVVAAKRLIWTPAAVDAPLEIDLGCVFV